MKTDKLVRNWSIALLLNTILFITVALMCSHAEYHNLWYRPALRVFTGTLALIEVIIALLGSVQICGGKND